MIDRDLRVYLIEVNKNPCLSTLSDSQRILIDKLLEDTLQLTIDPLFKLQPKRKPSSVGNRYELVYAHFY